MKKTTLTTWIATSSLFQGLFTGLDVGGDNEETWVAITVPMIGDVNDVTVSLPCTLVSVHKTSCTWVCTRPLTAYSSFYVSHILQSRSRRRFHS